MPSQFWASFQRTGGSHYALPEQSLHVKCQHSLLEGPRGEALSLHGEGRGLAESSRPAISTVTVLTPTLSPDLSPLCVEYSSVLPRLEKLKPNPRSDLNDTSFGKCPLTITGGFY